MIILEGCDGTGKSNLVKCLSEDLNLPVHPRASTSIGGPVPDVYNWARADVDSWDTQPLSIYDRHPLVSELIYGPIVRGRIDDRFHTDTALYEAFSKMALVIWCDPGWDFVLKNLSRSDQMPGVIDNSKRLLLMYRTYARVFPGMAIKWNYNISSYNEIRVMCEQHIKWWEMLND